MTHWLTRLSIGGLWVVLSCFDPQAGLAQDQGAGDSGTTRRQPSGRSRLGPQRPVPNSADQVPPETAVPAPKRPIEESPPVQSPETRKKSEPAPVVVPAPQPESKPALPPVVEQEQKPTAIPPIVAPTTTPDNAIAQPKAPLPTVDTESSNPAVKKGEPILVVPSEGQSQTPSGQEAPRVSPNAASTEAEPKRQMPSGRIGPARTMPEAGASDEKPETAPAPVAPALPVEVPEKPLPTLEPQILVQPPPSLPVLPDPDSKPTDQLPVGPSKPAGGDAPATIAPFAQPIEGETNKRLPGGRIRPSTAQSQPTPVIANEGDPSQAQIDEYARSNFLPIRDRWRILSSGGLLDPYSQNVLKADFPVIGQNVFLNVTAVSDSLFEARTLPTAQGVSRVQAGSGEFFGRGRQLFFNQNFVTSFELFQGSTGFKPRDWAVRLTPVFNVNYLKTQENNVVKLDVRDGSSRTDNQIAFQEAFVEKRLADVSKNFDFVSVRAGIQGFTSDFRGFIFSDNEPGVRFFGNFDNNRYQWNIAYFNLLEKDTNSMLNSFELRHRQVVVANLYRQDFIWQGYTTQLSFHHDRDDSGTQDPNGQQYDRNGFLVRPAKIGDVRPNNIRSYYLGWAGDGHIGRFNISHAIYQVLGDATHDPIAGRAVSINAQMAAVEVSYDIDWLRPKVSVFYGSGDRNPTDGTARGFDSILDNVNFAGSGFSFWNRQGVGLTQTGINLNNRFSLLNDFRSSKTQGQAQFVNPGVIVANAGLDAELTPKLKAVLNFNYLWFAATEPLKYVLHQPQVRNTIGADYSIGFIYRPLLSQNIVLSGGIAYFTPGPGFRDIQVNENLYSAFFSATLTF